MICITAPTKRCVGMVIMIPVAYVMQWRSGRHGSDICQLGSLAVDRKHSDHIIVTIREQPVASLPASGPWAPPNRTGPALESIYRVSLTVDLCRGNITSLKKLFHHSQLRAPQKEKNPGALGTCPVCPLVNTALGTTSS